MAFRAVSLAVLAVALIGVVLGLDWQSAPVSGPAAGAAPPAVEFPALPSSREAAQGSNAPALPDGADASPAARAPRAEANEDSAPPGCNVAACEQAYRSFRKADCTYQPNNGPRRLCRKP